MTQERIEELEEELFLAEVNTIYSLLQVLEEIDVESLAIITGYDPRYVNDIILDCINDSSPELVEIVSDWDKHAGISFCGEPKQ